MASPVSQCATLALSGTPCTVSTPSSAVNIVQQQILMQPATPTSSDAVEIVPYPAPLPQFSVPIRNVLRSGDKKQLMLLYSEAISEAAKFYLFSLTLLSMVSY